MSVLSEESKAASVAGAEWEEEREEMRTKRERGPGHGRPGGTRLRGPLTMFGHVLFTLPEPDKGPSVLLIRNRQNSSASSQVEWMKHKKMEGVLCKTVPRVAS